MIVQILISFSSFLLSSGFPTEQYYGSPNNYEPYALNYQPRSVYYYPNEINRPILHQNLGMSPQYHNLVYNYIKDFAGTELPTDVQTANILNDKEQNSFHFSVQETLGNPGIVSEGSTNKKKETVGAENHPSTQFFGQLDSIKTKRMNFREKATSLPPVAGVISNYVLLRTQPNPQSLLQFPGTFKESEVNLQHIKRQIPDDSDGVVILAEPPQSPKNSEQAAEHREEEDENSKDDDQQMEAHPGIAQSKPSAIALAGPGGMAQASPVGTALVGQGGLAVAAPSGTAVAGPAGQGAIPIQIGSEKQKSTEKSEEPDTD